MNDTLVLAFIATPSRASMDNPHLPGTPFLFSNAKGLWTMRIDIRPDPNDPTIPMFIPRMILPVIQVGDTIDGAVISDITIHDGLGRGTKLPNGTTRTPGRADHYLGFHVETDQGDKAIRVRYFDTDEDGLPDHWEESGGGIDMDADGIMDLELSLLNADPLRKDLYLEIDWTPNRIGTRGMSWSNEPQAGILSRIVDMFATAPVSNPDGTTGITLHIDAGIGLDVGTQSTYTKFTHRPLFT